MSILSLLYFQNFVGDVYDQPGCGKPGQVVQDSFSKDYIMFLDVLICVRKRRQFTQKEVAAQMNKPLSFVSEYESGERRLDVTEFCRIAEILQESPVSLLREMGFVQ